MDDKLTCSDSDREVHCRYGLQDFCEDCPIIKSSIVDKLDYDSIARKFKVNVHIVSYIITWALRQIGRNVYPYKIGFYKPIERCCGKCVNYADVMEIGKGCNLEINYIDECIQIQHKFFRDANRSRVIKY